MRRRGKESASASPASSGLLGVDESLFALPEAEAVGPPVDVGAVLRGLDEGAAELTEADLADPALLAELAAVAGEAGADGADGDAKQGGGGQEEDEEGRLRAALAEERAALALFAAAGEDTGPLAAQVAHLQAQLAALEGPARRALDRRVAELRQAALAWKQAGDKPRAMLYLRQSKEATLDNLPPAPELPPPPVLARPRPPEPSPPAAQETEQATPVDPAHHQLAALRDGRALRQRRDEAQWEKFIEALRDEARRCNALAREYKSAGQKQEAVDCLRRQKETMSMLEHAFELRTSGAPPPDWEASCERLLPAPGPPTDPEAPAEGLLVELKRGGDVVDAKGEPVSAFVKFVCSYGDDNPSIQSPTAPSSRSPEWNWQGQLGVPTHKKSFRLHCDRRPLKCELWASHGWLRGGDVLLGTAQVPLAPLLTQGRVEGVYSVMTVGKKRPAGPRLEVTVRVRAPLNSVSGADAGAPAPVAARWIEVKGWPAEGPSPEATAELEEEKRLEALIEARRQQQANGHGEENRLVSARVLAWMVDQLLEESGRSVDPSGAVLQQLARVRRRQLQVTASTDEKYLADLRTAIEDETSRAAKCKHEGARDAALQCLRRAKIMKDELAELEEERARKLQESATKAAAAAAAAATAATTAVPSSTTAPPFEAVPSNADDEDFRSVDNICSVAVLDWELSQLTNLDDEAQALRKTDLEIKKQMIIMAIQMEQLTVEKYAAALNARIALDKKLAKAFKDQGRKGDALYVLKRAKLMETELNS